MQVVLGMSLPREAVSVPVVRRICKETLNALGVAGDCVADIEVAVTEACTNVLQHAEADEVYDVEIDIEQDFCRVRVIDAGGGFDRESVGRKAPAEDAEGGRGLLLMSLLVDELRFTAESPTGNFVELTKELHAEDESTLRRLSTPHGDLTGSTRPRLY